MCVWCIIKKTAWLYGIVLGNQHKPEEGGSHQTIAATLDQKRNPEADRHDGGTQSIHIQIGQMWYASLQATMKSRWIPVG
jgi:hypothetical protein